MPGLVFLIDLRFSDWAFHENHKLSSVVPIGLIENQFLQLENLRPFILFYWLFFRKYLKGFDCETEEIFEERTHFECKSVWP